MAAGFTFKLIASTFALNLLAVEVGKFLRVSREVRLGLLLQQCRSPGQQSVQVRPAVAQGQLRGMQRLFDGQKQHGSARAGIVLLFFVATAAAAGGEGTAVEAFATLGVFRLFPLVLSARRPLAKANAAFDCS